MLKRKFKTIISMLLMTVLSLSLIACGKEKVVEEPDIQVELAEHQVFVYLVDAWKKTNPETQKEDYHTTLLVNAETFFAELTLDDVEYLVGTEYKPIADAVTLTNSNIYQTNDGNNPGVCTYIHLTTNELIDLNKVFVTVCGAEEKENIGLDRTTYKSKLGSLDGFVEIVAGVEEREIPLSHVLPLQTKIDENVIVLWDENESKFHFKNDPKALCLDTTAAYMMLEVDPLTNTDLSVLIDALNKEGKIGDYKDGKFLEWEDNEDFQIYSEINDGYLCVGYTADSLMEYDVIPTAISLTSNGHEYIIRLFE